VLGLITFALLLTPAFVRVAWFYFTSPKGACRGACFAFHIYVGAAPEPAARAAAAARCAVRRCAAMGALRAQRRARAAACVRASVLSSVARR
jgi:hypothetical protein